MLIVRGVYSIVVGFGIVLILLVILVFLIYDVRLFTHFNNVVCVGRGLDSIINHKIGL